MRKTSKIRIFIKKRFELQCLSGEGPNYNVPEEMARITIICKEKVGITRFVRITFGIAVFVTIKSELQCLKG